MGISPFRWMAVALSGAALLLLFGVGGLYGVRAVESYNPFCTACHLPDHQAYLDEGRRTRPEVKTLSAWHLSGGKVRCISCHGEEGVAGMARTTWLASGDLWRFIRGDYKQPSRVFHPIQDKDCVKCHGDERLRKLPEDAFHAMTEHLLLTFACVDCHNGHRIGGKRKGAFIVPSTAQPRCDSCHLEFGQKVRPGA